MLTSDGLREEAKRVLAEGPGGGGRPGGNRKGKGGGGDTEFDVEDFVADAMKALAPVLSKHGLSYDPAAKGVLTKVLTDLTYKLK